jgi:hypothetical protein
MSDGKGREPDDERDERVFFSLDEANRLVPEVAQRFDAVFERVARVREITAHLSSLGGAYPGPLRAEMLRLHQEIQAQLQALEKRGCVIKDIQRGLVDFWHRRGDDEVFLCWRYGETRIEWFHDPAEGFAGRKPLESSGLDVAGDTGEKPPPKTSVH